MGKIILHFDHTGTGLICKGETLTGFTICGEECHFVPARAIFNGRTVEVCAEGVEEPVVVRYGWANYAELNLYNKEGLPAGPFRTDDFLMG